MSSAYPGNSEGPCAKAPLQTGLSEESCTQIVPFDSAHQLEIMLTNIVEENESDEDEDGDPMVDIDDDVDEFDEIETLQILAWHGGRNAVRKELQHRKNDRGYGKKSADSKDRVPKLELLAKTRCFNCGEMGHMSRDCKKPGKKPNFSGPRRGFFGKGKGKGKGKGGSSARPALRDKDRRPGSAPRRAFVIQIGTDGVPNFREAVGSDPVDTVHFFMLTARPSAVQSGSSFIGVVVTPGPDRQNLQRKI